MDLEIFKKREEELMVKVRRNKELQDKIELIQKEIEGVRAT